MSPRDARTTRRGDRSRPPHARWAALALAVESLVATIAGWQLANVEFRLAALAAFVALALLGPQRYALDLKSPRLASWSRLSDTRGPASKAA